MNLKRYLINVVFRITLLLPALVLSADSNLQRVLNLALSDGGPSRLPYNDSYLIKQFEKIKNMSAVIPLLLNVNPKNLAQFQQLLTYFNQSNIKVYPGLGNGKTPINSPKFQEMAKGYNTFTNCIQLNNVQKYSEAKPTEPNGPSGLDNLTAMIDYLTNNLTFKHIQLNAWPIDYSVEGSPQAIYFSNSAVDSAQELVQLDDTQVEAGQSNPGDWTINPKKIHLIRNANPTAVITSNYENPGQEMTLSNISTAAQLNAFQKTIKNDESYTDVYWTAPWSVNYNPIANGTWGFIIRHLSDGDT